VAGSNLIYGPKTSLLTEMKSSSSNNVTERVLTCAMLRTGTFFFFFGFIAPKTLYYLAFQSFDF
jgi:hypothetical protein